MSQIDQDRKAKIILNQKLAARTATGMGGSGGLTPPAVSYSPGGVSPSGGGYNGSYAVPGLNGQRVNPEYAGSKPPSLTQVPDAPAGKPQITPASIAPPVMPDWRAAAVPGGAQAPAAPPPASPELRDSIRIKELQGAQGGAAPAPEMGPPAPDRRAMIEQARVRAMLADRANLKQMGYIDSQLNHGGLSPEDAASFQASRRGLAMDRMDTGNEMDLYSRATAPSIHPQSPEQIRAGQADLWKRGIDLADSQIKDLIPRFNQPGADRAALQQQLQDAMQRKQVFGQKFDDANSIAGAGHDASYAAAEKSAAGQGRIREQQDVTRENYGQAADMAMAARKRQIEINMIRNRQAMSQAQTGLAEQEGKRYEAEAGANPDIARSRLQTKVDIEAAQARRAKAEGVVTAKAATDVETQAKTRDEAAEGMLKEIGPHLSNMRGKGVDPEDYEEIHATSESVGRFLDRVRQLPPEAQDFYRRRLLDTLGTANPDDLYIGKPWQGAADMIPSFNPGLHIKIRRGIAEGNATFQKVKDFLFPAGTSSAGAR